MAIDPSIILSGQTKPVDPLALAGQALALKNALITNQGNQQQLEGRNALGRIYAGAIENGQLVPNKLTQGFADPQNSAAGYLAPEVFQQEQARRKGELENTSAQVELAHKQIGYFQDTLGSLIAKKDLSPDDIYNAAGDAISSGMMTQDQAKTELGSLPQMDPAKQADPAYQAQYQSQLRNWTVNHWARLKDLGDQLKAHYGDPFSVSAGNATVMGYNNPINQQSQVIGAVETGLSPGEQVSPAYQRYNSATHQMETVTKGDALAAQGGAPGVLAGAAGIPAAPAVGETENLTATAQAAAQAYNDAVAKSGAYRSTKAPLYAEIDDLVRQGAGTGPQSQITNYVGRLFSQGIDNEALKRATANSDLLQKDLAQLQQQNVANQGGVATGDKIGAAQQATPHQEMSTQGLLLAKATLQGTDQANDLAVNAYNHYKAALPAGQQAMPFNQYAIALNSQIDPLTLILRSMPKEQEAHYLRSMTPQQREKITEASKQLDRLAKGLGWKP